MKRNAGYLYLLITFFCWGSIYVVSKYALAVMGPVTVSFCRYLVSVVCLYGILKWKGGHKKIAKEHWPYLLILGGLGYFAAIILQLGGTALLSGSLASLINSLNPVMISILAAVFLKEKITWKNVLSIVVSLIGVYIILGNGSMQINPLGILLSAGSVVLWSAASVSIRKISGYYDPVQIALYGMCIALLFNIPAAVLENVFLTQSHPTVVALLACLFVAVFGTAVAHTCWNCGKEVQVPNKIIIGKNRVLLNQNTKLVHHHVYDDFDMDTVVGAVVQNPKNPALWGIRNEDKVNWTYQKADGTQIPVVPGKTAGIAKGVKILFPESTGEFK